MNEIFLILLIVCTLITFIRLNRRIGASSCVIPGTSISDREHIYYEDGDISNHRSHMSKHVISSKDDWSATTTYENIHQNIVFVYHRCNNSDLNTLSTEANSRVYTQNTNQYNIEYL